jgi:hypothetical protein
MEVSNQDLALSEPKDDPVNEFMNSFESKVNVGNGHLLSMMN